MLITNINQKGELIQSDEHGNWYRSTLEKGRSRRGALDEANPEFMTVEELEVRMKGEAAPKAANASGFIISRPSTLKERGSKFRPY